jgi:hypothetical protein
MQEYFIGRYQIINIVGESITEMGSVGWLYAISTFTN